MVKDELLALLDSLDANGGFTDEGFARFGELVERIRIESPWPEPTRTLHKVEGRWETVFAHFGGKVNAGKTRVHDSTLALQSWNRFPPAPIRVERICQEISRQGNAYNNVIDFSAPPGASRDGQAHGAIVVRGTFRDDPDNAQRFVVEGSLGTGGMGTVHVALDQQTGLLVPNTFAHACLVHADDGCAAGH